MGHNYLMKNYSKYFLENSLSHIFRISLSEILIAQLVRNLPAMQETLLNSWFGKIPWRSDRLPAPVFLGFPCGSAGKESTCSVEDLGLIPGLGRSPGEENGYLPQYSCLENSTDRGAWRVTGHHGVTKNRP